MIMSEMPHFEIKREEDGETPCAKCLCTEREKALNNLADGETLAEAMADTLSELSVHTCQKRKDASCIADATNEAVPTFATYEKPEMQKPFIDKIFDKASEKQSKLPQ
jgi:hypothetical protein